MHIVVRVDIGRGWTSHMLLFSTANCISY
jgi:hypothetical protein